MAEIVRNIVFSVLMGVILILMLPLLLLAQLIMWAFGMDDFPEN